MRKNSQTEQFPEVKQDNWSAEKISEEAVNEDPGDILQKMLIGAEINGDSKASEIAGKIEIAKIQPRGEENFKTQIKNQREQS